MKWVCAEQIWKLVEKFGKSKPTSIKDSHDRNRCSYITIAFPLSSTCIAPKVPEKLSFQCEISYKRNAPSTRFYGIHSHRFHSGDRGERSEQ